MKATVRKCFEIPLPALGNDSTAFLSIIIGIIENEFLVKLENGIKTGRNAIYYINFAASVAISFTCLSNSFAPNNQTISIYFQVGTGTLIAN